MFMKYFPIPILFFSILLLTGCPDSSDGNAPQNAGIKGDLTKDRTKLIWDIGKPGSNDEMRKIIHEIDTIKDFLGLAFKKDTMAEKGMTILSFHYNLQSDSFYSENRDHILNHIHTTNSNTDLKTAIENLLDEKEESTLFDFAFLSNSMLTGLSARSDTIIISSTSINPYKYFIPDGFSESNKPLFSLKFESNSYFKNDDCSNDIVSAFTSDEVATIPKMSIGQPCPPQWDKMGDVTNAIYIAYGKLGSKLDISCSFPEFVKKIIGR